MQSFFLAEWCGAQFTYPRGLSHEIAEPHCRHLRGLRITHCRARFCRRLGADQTCSFYCRLPARRRHRPCCAHPAAQTLGQPWHPGHRRQSPRRQRRDLDADPVELGTGRSLCRHVAYRLAGGQPGDPENQLRPAQGPRAYRHAGHAAEHPDRASVSAGEKYQRVHRLRQKPARQSQLRHLRHRQPRPPRRRIVRRFDRHDTEPCPLQRRRPCHHRLDRRPHSRLHGGDLHRRAACAIR